MTIPFVKTEVGATSADYRGVPSSVTFNSGDTEQTFTVTTVNDDVDDDDERIELSFGTPLPEAVTASGITVDATIEITDDDAPRGHGQLRGVVLHRGRGRERRGHGDAQRRPGA